MKILIEGYNYDADKRMLAIVHELTTLENIDRQICVNYVGYFFNPHKDVQDCVFILPKVLVNENDKVFGHIKPEDLIDVESCKEMTEEERHFIYEFAVWIYRAIAVFSKDKAHKDIVLRKQFPQVGFRKRHLTNTYLDIIHTMVEFNRMNKSYFTFILKNLHSGFNRIHWPKTIARTTAIVQDEEPFYLRPMNRKRMINFDEELLIIFFSILKYIHEHYGFPVEINNGFDLITGKRFEQYLKGFGKTRLKQIKYKYFSDKALQIWELCYAFFERAHQIAVPSDQREYLIVKNFNIVFEAIIDELIGDKLDKGMENELKNQPDGKLVDHIFKYRSLTTNEEDERKNIFYIGDSKYYKIGAQVGKESVYKQYTYVRNVIQWNLNLFFNETDEKRRLQQTNPKLRDEETEGYNITPNFFISADIDFDADDPNKRLSYKDDIHPVRDKRKEFITYHFENRLFDRDTLLISHYNVNFLYVVSLYARDNQQQKAAWKKKVKDMFRSEIQAMLGRQYQFYAMTALPGTNAHEYLKEHFKEVIGKTYKPYTDQRYFSLALDKGKGFADANEKLLGDLRKYFRVEKCDLGQNPEEVLPVVTTGLPQPADKSGVLMVMMEGYENKCKRFLSTGEIAVGLKLTKTSMEISEHLSSIGYILFHTRKDEGQHLFLVKEPCKILNGSEIDESIYKNIRTTGLYVRVSFDAETECDTKYIHPALKPIAAKEERYDAQFAWLDGLSKN